LSLVGVFFKRFHSAFHLAFLGGHRAQAASNRDFPANLLIVSPGRVFALGRLQIIAPVHQPGIGRLPRPRS
jgi:hypothetical protein